jgi:hypothetical protein
VMYAFELKVAFFVSFIHFGFQYFGLFVQF